MVQPSALPQHQRAYWTAWIATFLFFAGFYALLVPLPRYLAIVGLPDWQIGLVLGAFGVASLLGRPLAGVAVDRWGARRVMLVGAAALLLGAGGVPFSSNVWLLFGLRLLQAIGYVAFTTAGTALVVILSAPSERGQRLAVFGAAANVAITLTPALVTALLTMVSLSLGLWLSSLLAFVAGLLALSMPATVTRQSSDHIAQQAGFPRQLWIPMLAAGALGAGFAAFFQFAPILAERRGTIDAGSLYTVYGLSIIATRVFGGRIIDRLQIDRLLLIAVGLTAGGLGLLAWHSEAFWLGSAAALVAVGGGLFHPTLIAHHARLLPEAPGRATAAFYVGFDLGIGVGSWIFGFALQFAGLAGLYGSATLIVLTTLLMIPQIARQTNPTH